MTERVLNTRAAAAFLGVHPNTLKRYSPTELPYFMVSARGDRRYALSDLDAFRLRHRVNEPALHSARKPVTFA